MKRIVLCFDGTWNTPADEALPPDLQVETNVRRFFNSVNSVADNGVRQVRWYDAGVGTDWYNRLTGGAFGAWLGRHIRDGYRQLVDHYEQDDHIYVVGFSRGAYAARSLVGMLRNCGLLTANHADRVSEAYDLYRDRDDRVDSKRAVNFRSQFSREVKIKFLGLWDTVGALGIPLRIAKEASAELYSFHDTELSGIVENAYQALAIDEHREDYKACLWDPVAKRDQTLEQRWFCGAHCDVGGGYRDRELSDLTLNWIQEKAAGLGLQLTKTTVGPRYYLGKSTNSYLEFLGGSYAKVKDPYLRSLLATKFGNELIDVSVESRRNDVSLNPRYAPKNLK